jgi:hypothetical protein
MRRIAIVLLLGGLGCSKHARDDHGSPWTRVGIGSVFVTRSVTRMQKPFEHVTETTIKQTLVGRTDTEASVRLEIAEGSQTSTHDEKITLWQDPVLPHDGSTMTTTEEVCTVPAGTFPCTKTDVELTQGDVTRSNVTWTSKKVPVPLRSIVTTENMTITTELTSLKLL